MSVYDSLRLCSHQVTRLVVFPLTLYDDSIVTRRHNDSPNKLNRPESSQHIIHVTRYILNSEVLFNTSAD
ncbi:hypothetical protein KGM_202891 [Danaus plexippus plexippus]|uniref:Uncharacterized protein n=1 Tax=Danaus plexippus plexippus TaxID=278856 RepID=A0A212F3T7_DANPL|nr:hypothetical protein KGM_202891 [Danaus plexippus plexippus]